MQPAKPNEMSSELAQLHAKLDLLLKRFAHLGEPDLTVKEFAKRAGRSRTTIHQRIAEFKIVTRDGRIPASELAKFTSLSP